MNQSILITGGNFSTRNQKAQKLATEYLNLKNTNELTTHPDFTQITPDETASIGISQIRELNKDLLLRPLRAPLRVALFSQAELLTLEAQNAFLKTLEEPPERVTIILCTRDPQMILSTLVSRCRLITLAVKPEIELLPEEGKKLEQILSGLPTASLGQKFAWAESFGQNKDDALSWIDKMTIVARILLLKSLCQTPQVKEETKKYQTFLKKISPARTFIKSNVNPRFALENLFLSC